MTKLAILIVCCGVALTASAGHAYREIPVSTSETIALQGLRNAAPQTVRKAAAASRAFRAEKWEEALRLYGEVHVEAPRFSEALRRMCIANHSLGRREEAISLCDKALQIAWLPDNEVAMARVLVLRRDEPISDRERRRALSHAKSALGKGKDNFAIVDPVCQVALRLQEIPLLQKCAAHAMRLGPKKASTRLFMTHLALADGQLDQAADHLDAARAAGLDDATYRRLDSVITERTPLTARYGRILVVGVGGWAGIFFLLVVMGGLLSSATLRWAEHLPADPHTNGSGHSQLRRAYAAVLWLTCAYYYISLPLLVLLVLALAGGICLVSFAIGRIPIGLMVVLAVVVLVTLWAVIKSLYVSVVKRGTDENAGQRLSLTGNPKFAAAVKEVAKRVGTEPVDTVFINPDTEVAVFERGGVLKLVTGRPERCLILGAGLLDGLNKGDLKVILAHEFGHLVNRDTAGGSFALSVRRSLTQMARTLAEGGAATWYNPAWWFIDGFCRVFFRISQGASRLQEVQADRWAALAFGAASFSEGLRKVLEQSLRFDAHLAATFAEVIDGRKTLHNLYRYQPARTLAEDDLQRRLRMALNASPSPYDSHPRPVDRIQFVQTINQDAKVEAGDDDPAWDLFRDRAAIEVQMTGLVSVGDVRTTP